MPYAELHCHSAYSFLDGASHPAELAAAAAEQGHEAVALTDHDGVHGSLEFAGACAPLGVRAITGAEVTLTDGSHLTLLCESAEGYRNLCRVLTRAHAHTREGREASPPSVSLPVVGEHAAGLVCLSGCARDGAVAGRIERGDHAGAAWMASRLLAAFGPERLRIELQRPFARRDRRRNRLLSELSERIGVPCIATGNVHAHERGRAELQDVLTAVRLRSTLDETEPGRRGNSSHVLAPPEAMAERFAEHPGAAEESGRLAERLRFDITHDLGYRYPGSEDATADRSLAELCRARLGDRYAGRAALAAAGERLEEELGVIRRLGLSGFFLLHRDLLELAREVACEVRGPSAARAALPPGRGRGSSVSSIVCYLTGLSHVDPVENRLSLGRFLNDDLSALPDIDLDFPRDVREELIPRVHERYGHDRSALVASFSCYRARGAVRDIGKALGLPPGEIERVARSADMWLPDIERDVREAVGERRLASPRWRALVRLVSEAQGLPRHLSQHPGGMVISTQPITDICPVVPAAMERRRLLQWDKDSCGDAGLLKIDLLGLGMLSAVERCVDEIARNCGEVIDLSRIPYDDPEVYASIQRAETTGVFQIESRAQMQMLVRTLPESLDDLTVQVALVRPGPIMGGAVHPYLRRKKALREDPSFEIPYEHPSLEPALRDTLGAIVFQDQVIEVAQAFAGFSAGQAEGLRRAMSRKRSEAAMLAYERRFVEGAMELHGVSRELAERVYSQIAGFSGFGFPKSHSAAFGLLAYQSTWLRVHHGPEFLCGLMNEQPMGFYPPDALAHDAQRRGIEVRPPDVNESEVLCTTEPAGGGAFDRAVRVGIAYVNGARASEVAALVAERERGGPFSSPADLAARCASRRETLELLAWAGACDALCGGRREALWLLGVAAPGVATGTGEVQLALPFGAEVPELPGLTAWERLVADYGSTKVTLQEHPLGLLRPELGPGVMSSADLAGARHGSSVRVAGLVVARQRPSTANGVTFMLLEDEQGTINLIVPPPVHERCRLAVRTEPLVTAGGRLERRDGVVNVLVDRVERLDRPGMPVAEVRSIEPGRAGSPAAGEEIGNLRAVAPAGHSFGQRR